MREPRVRVRWPSTDDDVVVVVESLDEGRVYRGTLHGKGWGQPLLSRLVIDPPPSPHLPLKKKSEKKSFSPGQTRPQGPPPPVCVSDTRARHSMYVIPPLSVRLQPKVGG